MILAPRRRIGEVSKGRQPETRLFATAFVGAIVVVAAVDAWLGPEAGYFNAWETLKRLAGQRTPGHVVIHGEARLGLWALPLAALILFGGAALMAAVAAVVARRLRRR